MTHLHLVEAERPNLYDLLSSSAAENMVDYGDVPVGVAVVAFGAIASHRAWRSLGTRAGQAVSALSRAITIALDCISDFRFVVGVTTGAFATVFSAMLWAGVL